MECVYPGPANITLNAAASDTDGTVSRVDFYAERDFPRHRHQQSLQLSTCLARSRHVHSLTAVARDDGGASTTSGRRDVIVSGTSVTADDSGVHAVARSRDARVLVLGCAPPQQRSGHGNASRDEEHRQAVTGQRRDLRVHHRHRDPVTFRLVLRSGDGNRFGRIGPEHAVAALHQMS